MAHMLRELHFLNFSPAIDPRTITHKFGGHLDQIFARGVDITNALVNDGFDSGVTDHKCLKVTLKIKQHQVAPNNQLANFNTDHQSQHHLLLPQMTLRKLINSNQTICNMIDAQNVIDQPAFSFMKREELQKELSMREDKLRGTAQQRKHPIRYRTRTQMEEEKEELAIAEELDNL